MALAVCSVAGLGYAQEIHIAHCMAGGCPAGAPAKNDLVVREIYALSNNGDRKFADWVAYGVTRETIGRSDSLDREWKNDDLLEPGETLEGEEADAEEGENDFGDAYRRIRTDRHDFRTGFPYVTSIPPIPSLRPPSSRLQLPRDVPFSHQARGTANSALTGPQAHQLAPPGTMISKSSNTTRDPAESSTTTTAMPQRESPRSSKRDQPTLVRTLFHLPAHVRGHRPYLLRHSYPLAQAFPQCRH